jgi:hypothetical protein
LLLFGHLDVVYGLVQQPNVQLNLKPTPEKGFSYLSGKKSHERQFALGRFGTRRLHRRPLGRGRNDNLQSCERDEPLQKRKKLEYSDETTTRQGRDLFSSGDEEDRKPAAVGATNAHMSTLLISSIVPLSQADEPQYTHMTAFDRRFEGETEVCEQV